MPPDMEYYVLAVRLQNPEEWEKEHGMYVPGNRAGTKANPVSALHASTLDGFQGGPAKDPDTPPGPPAPDVTKVQCIVCVMLDLS